MNRDSQKKLKGIIIRMVAGESEECVDKGTKAVIAI